MKRTTETTTYFHDVKVTDVHVESYAQSVGLKPVVSVLSLEATENAGATLFFDNREEFVKFAQLVAEQAEKLQ